MKKIIFFFLLLFTGVINAQSPGTLDTSFNTGGTGSSGFVLAFAEQSDGKIVIGGNFVQYNGVAKNSFLRLNADGSIDTTFMQAMAGFNQYATIRYIVIDNNGKILVGGSFSSINGVARNGIVRLNSDGSLDTSFAPVLDGTAGIHSISIQADNKIIIAGSNFSMVNGVARNRIARLNTDGSLDASFAPVGTGGEIYSTAIQNDGKILVGGAYTFMNGVAKNYICRMNTDGTLDTTFSGSGAGAYVNRIVLQPDGKIIVGGNFTFMNGVSRNKICRLNTDGSVDASFDSSSSSNTLVPNGDVTDIALLPDGKMFIGGVFGTINGVIRGFFAKIDSNGIVDTTIGGNTSVGPNYRLDKMKLLSDGKLLIGGDFTTFAGTTIGRIAKIHTGITCLLSPPTVPQSTIYYNLNASATPLIANGTNLLWYTTASGGTGTSVAPTPNTTTTGLTSYWVSQNDGAGCESGRTKMDVIVNPGTHLKFDGINDYVTISGVNFPNQTYTVEMMANINNADCTLFTVGSDVTPSPASYDRTIFFQGGLLKQYIWTGSATSTVAMGNSLTVGWHHIAITSSPSGRNLYIDGVNVGYIAASFAPTNMGNIILGKSPLVANYFNGEMDELRIWNVERTASQINSTKNCELFGNETGLIAYYKFNQGVAGSNLNATAANTLNNNASNISYGNGTMNNFNYDPTTSNWVSGSPIASNVSCASLQNEDFQSKNWSLRLYPNPAKEIVHITSDSEIKELVLYNLQGQIVVTTSQKEINVSNLQSGVYLVRAEDINGAIATQKLVID